MRRFLSLLVLAALLPSGAAAAVAPTVAPVPPPAAAVQSVSWFGFTVGGPVAAYRAGTGDPVRLASGGDPRFPPSVRNRFERKARYLISKDGNVFIDVLETHGAVSGFEVFSSPDATSARTDLPPDPNGVRLGDDESVLASHVTGLVHTPAGFAAINTSLAMATEYDIANGHIVAVLWRAQHDFGAPAGPASFSEVTGAAQTSAILVVERTDSDSTLWEKYYYAAHPCDNGNGVWRETGTNIVHDGNRVYEENPVTCVTTGAKREFWFDITAGFGK